jgi:hypothetical protein
VSIAFSHAEPDQKASPEGSERYGDRAVHANNPWSNEWSVRNMMRRSMFGHMVAIALAQNPQQRIEPTEVRDPKRNLKIDQIRSAVVAHEHVFLFVQIDIGNASRVEVLQQLVQLLKELPAHVVRDGKGFAFNEFVCRDMCCPHTVESDFAADSRDAWNALERCQELGFAASEHASQPSHGKEADRSLAVEFADDPFPRRRRFARFRRGDIDGCRGPRIMLENLVPNVPNTVCLEMRGRLCPPQSP